jgi:hypothetical protein
MTAPGVKGLDVEPGRHDLFESNQNGAERAVTGLAFGQL